jgi:acyl-CoA reductase-like NAD-dependent aldehyde dehydrogenase
MVAHAATRCRSAQYDLSCYAILMIAAQKNSQRFSVTNPATGQPIGELPIDSRDDVGRAMERVRRASKFWAALTVEERCRRLVPVAKLITERMDDIAETISRENGKVRYEALSFDIGPLLLSMNYFIENAPRILAPEPIQLAITPHRKSYLSYQPRGVIAVISPWNFPFFLPGCDTIMSLIAGSGVLLKPSEVTPFSSLALKSCLDDGGIDPELVQVVTGFGETGAAVIDAKPDHVVFTGSVATGRKIGVACAERMISYTLELGGKAPALVLEDADLDRTANAILWGGFANAGQICASVERVFAVAPVYDRLVEKLTDAASKLRVGGAEGESDVGSMTWPKQRDLVERLIADAKAKGARVTAGGERVGERGLYFQPTVLADCTADMDVMNAEIFGPILPIMKVESEDRALELANDSPLGLGAYVFTKDRERGKRVAEKIEAGSVMINDVLMFAGAPEMPWGGIKQSGLGVMRSDRGLRELCHARHVNYDRVTASWARDPWWFPYSKKTESQVKGFLKSIFADKPWSKWIRRAIS